MSATRSKLILDEQAFQGLLAAAFTVQQHNDRQKASSNSALLTEKPRPLGDPAELCRHCGAPLPSEAAFCPVCGGAESLRPGERLQRTWASMWQMSQEHGVRHDPADDTGALAFNRRGDGPNLPDSASEVLSPIRNVDPEVTKEVTKPPAQTSGSVSDFVRAQTSSAVSSLPNTVHGWRQEKIEGPPEHSHHSLQPVPSAALSSGEGCVLHDPLLHSPLREDLSLDLPPLEDPSLAESSLPDSSLDDASVADAAFDDPSLPDLSIPDLSFDGGPLANPETDATVATPSTASPFFRRLRATLSLDRADFYLAIAFLVAATALLWPSATSPLRHLSPWERVLVSLGVAEAPPPAIHYRGDPNIKVWVDTHTALYYCPGDDLYGKSPDGRFTTQHEAQADRFEPAQRSACIQ